MLRDIMADAIVPKSQQYIRLPKKLIVGILGMRFSIISIVLESIIGLS